MDKSCEECGGAGYRKHNCGEDSCCCLDRSDEDCENCDGSGVVGPTCPGCGVVQDPGESTGYCESCYQARNNQGF